MARAAHDVVIVGAGAAGLAAAGALAGEGLDVVILEARRRIGGRIFTEHAHGRPPIELGAEFVHPPADATRRLARKAGLVLEPVSEGRLRKEGAAFRPDDRWEGVERLMAGLEGLRRDVSFDDFLARSRAEPVAREAARRFVESFHGADAGRISAKSIAGQEGGGGWRLAGGYDALFDALRRGDGARLRLGAVVTSVRWRRGDVELGLRSGATVRARTCLLTLPLPILQRQTVRFEPALRAKFAALRGLAMGSACRVTALLPGRLEQPESFFMDPGSDFPVWWSQGRGPWTLLTAWAGGPRAALLAGAGREAVLDAARFSLARLLGRIDVRSFHYHDWDAAPFALGAYSYALVGSNGARKALAEPLEDTLFFAGEATDVQGNEATVEGAIASGLRAAKELTSRLARCS